MAGAMLEVNVTKDAIGIRRIPNPVVGGGVKEDFQGLYFFFYFFVIRSLYLIVMYRTLCQPGDLTIFSNTHGIFTKIKHGQAHTSILNDFKICII